MIMFVFLIVSFSFSVKATGSKGAIPYQRLAKGVINLTVNGMPEGQQLKDPSCYGINTMKAILKAPLRFEIWYV